MQSDLDGIDLQEAAERLDVHYQTAYKWVRSGRLDAKLVRGTYLLDPGVVANFAAQRLRPTKPAPRKPRQGFGPLSLRVLDGLLEGDEKGVKQTVDGLIEDGVSLATIIDELLAPALRLIGERWSQGTLGIATEHRASAIVERLLAVNNPNPRGRRRGVVVNLVLPGDHHSLPSSMAAAALREDNWHVHHLGLNMPEHELVAFCDENKVDLVVLSSTVSASSELSQEALNRMQQAGIRVLVGRGGATLAELQALARERTTSGEK